MTAIPAPPDHLPTVAEHAALGEVESASAVTDQFTTTEPFPIKIDVGQLD